MPTDEPKSEISLDFLRDIPLPGMAETADAMQQIQNTKMALGKMREMQSGLAQNQGPGPFNVPAGVGSVEAKRDSEGNVKLSYHQIGA